MTHPLTILHTADWHLGRTLYGRSRYDEFAAFLTWLTGVIHEKNVDVLLVAGDVFDTSTPSNRAQELYYEFLCTVAKSTCRHVVIIAGNHDSPSFLNAPKTVLRALNVHVVGAVSDRLEDEVLVLNDMQGRPEAIVCAVPYLRDRDIRQVDPGETMTDKHTKLLEGIRAHYRDVCQIAEGCHAALGGNLPMIGMGHLFTAGGQTVDGDGVRDLYVGSLAHVHADAFPASLDYLALGHLHIPQIVGQGGHRRYCGSPIPMGFGEAGQDKKILLVQFDGKMPIILEWPIPIFQPLERISGALDSILSRIDSLKLSGSNAWLEIEYTGTSIVGDLRTPLESAVSGSKMEIRRVKNKRLADLILTPVQTQDTLDELDVHQVFERCLDANEVPLHDRIALQQAYGEILEGLYENS